MHTDLEELEILGAIERGASVPLWVGGAVVGFYAVTWENRHLVFDAHGERLGDFANRANADSFIRRRWAREHELAQ